MDSVDQVSLRNLALAALVVWGVFAAVWYLLLHGEPPLHPPDVGVRPVAGASEPGFPSGARAGRADPTAQVKEPNPPPADSARAAGGQPAAGVAAAGETVSPPRIWSKAEETARSPARIEAPPRAPDAGSGGYTIQVGAFRSSQGATALRERLEEEGWNAEVVAGDLHRVFVGHYPSAAAARRDLERLKQLGLEGFVRRR